MKQETTNTNTNTSSPGRTSAHLLGFGLLLALILMVVRGTPQVGETTGRVTFTERDLKQVHARHDRT